MLHTAELSDKLQSLGALEAEPTEPIPKAVQPVAIDFNSVKQTLLKADKLYLEVRGFTASTASATTTATASAADQTDDSVQALVLALYHHHEHYDTALQISTGVYSTYSAWCGFLWLFRVSSTANKTSMYSACLRTTEQVQQWQLHIADLTTLLQSLKQDSSVADSCEQMCERILHTLTEATNMVNDVAPSEAVASQLTVYIQNNIVTTAMQAVNKVTYLYRAIYNDLHELEAQVGTDSVHYATVVELAASADLIKDWHGDTSTDKSIDLLYNRVSKHIALSLDLLQGLTRVYGLDGKSTQLCTRIVEQIERASDALAAILVAVQQVTYQCSCVSHVVILQMQGVVMLVVPQFTQFVCHTHVHIISTAPCAACIARWSACMV
jgi:hypothetical protein